MCQDYDITVCVFAYSSQGLYPTVSKPATLWGCRLDTLYNAHNMDRILKPYSPPYLRSMNYIIHPCLEIYQISN